MNQRIKKMNIVISGATKGIGRAIAQKFAQNNFNIAVCARNEGDLVEMKQAWTKEFPSLKCVYKVADVSKKEEVNTFADFVLSEFDNIDVLVNNAGVFIPGKIHEEEDGVLEKQINTNVYSAYNLTRKLLGGMIDKKSGHIFNICSTASFVAYPNGGSYSISKFALLGFSKVLREELKEHNIRVTSVLPGATYTASWEGVEIPVERFMKAQDVADAIYGVYALSKQTVVEELILRPQLGDIG